MIYQLMFGLVNIVIAVFIYNDSGLENPAKTLLAALFVCIAALSFLDDSDGEKIEE